MSKAHTDSKNNNRIHPTSKQNSNLHEIENYSLTHVESIENKAATIQLEQIDN